MAQLATLITAGPLYTVSTFTPLTGYIDISNCQSVIVTIFNPSGAASTLTLIVDPGDYAPGVGLVPNTSQRMQGYAVAGQPGSVTIANGLFGKIRIGAQSASPGFASVPGVTFSVRGIPLVGFKALS